MSRRAAIAVAAALAAFAAAALPLGLRLTAQHAAANAVEKDPADDALAMTEEEAYAAFAPDTAILIDLSLIGTNTITHAFAIRGEVGYDKETATIWWGDGTQDDIRTGYYGTTVSHTYPSAKGRYVLRISNLKHCYAFNEMRSAMMRNAVVRVLRWGDGPFVGSCVNCVNLTAFPDGKLARWPSGTTVLSVVYQNCGSLAATELPDWPKGLTRCEYVYMGDTKIAATKFPKWPETLVTIGSAGYGGVYMYCTGIRATEFPEWPKGAKTIGPVYHGCTGVRVTRIPAWPETLESLPSEYGQGVYGNCAGLAMRLDPVTNKWPQSLTSANGTYHGCTSLTGSIPAWPSNAAFASANSTYYNCSSLTGSIPAWPTNAAFASANSTYSGCTSLTGAIPAWPTNAAFASANSTYSGCTSLTGAWTTDPDELMPTNITSHGNTVYNASAALRALFYKDWGGSKERPTE